MKFAVWVEGDSDRRLFEAVVKPRLEAADVEVLVLTYRQRKTDEVNRKLLSMARQRFKRLFLTDLDSAPCITDRKEKAKDRYASLEDKEIIVVCPEIESWYLAGLSTEGAAALKMKPPSSTDRVTKQDLERMRPARLDSQLDFLVELLKYFDWSTACQRNRSFAYLHRTLDTHYA